MNSEEISAQVANLYDLQSMWLEPKLDELGITWATFQLLMAVAGGKDASQATIAERLGISPATLSESVVLHVKRGLLAQVASSKDRRVKSLVLTKDAERMVTKIRGLIKECSEVMTNGIPTTKLESCAKVLDDMANRLERSLPI